LGGEAFTYDSRFFHRRFLLWHLRHFVAVDAFRLPQSRQIFMYSLAFCAMVFFTGSSIGIIGFFLLGYHKNCGVSDIPFAPTGYFMISMVT
jgi:hypothetical protein